MQHIDMDVGDELGMCVEGGDGSGAAVGAL
jgi:hypothetical protein